jgi:cystathionine beta-lyase
MWVADMDFPSPPAVMTAVTQRVDHGVFGYATPWPSLIESVVASAARDGWQVEPDWLVWLPGLVTGLNVACRAVGKPGDPVLTATPVYPPFISAPAFSDRHCVRVPLTLSGAGWTWDFDAFEHAAAAARGGLFLFCHPHNPVGRAWTDGELHRLGEIVLRHELTVCSDEIHCGLILDPARRHRPFASLSADIAGRTITLLAPSKTYNVPGLGCSFAFIPDAALRARFQRVMAGIVPHVNTLGLTACEAAYRHGESWRQALLPVLRRNADTVLATVNALPGLSMQRVDATYLAWIDARGLDVADPAAFFEQAGLGLSDGKDFGAPGFVRLNFGCAPALLDEAMIRLRKAVNEHSHSSC